MNYVYAVGCLKIDDRPNSQRVIISDRLWHLFAHFDEAEEAVLNNKGDLFEMSYNYALIESTYVINKREPLDKDKMIETPQEWWYHADHSKATDENEWMPEITRCEKPAPLKNTIYFWIG